MWLKEAAAQGSSRIRVKMAHAVSIAKLTNPARVDWALGHAAVHQRFGEGDLASILAANLDPDHRPPPGRPGRTNPSPRAPPAGPPSAPPRANPPATPTATTAPTSTADQPPTDQQTSHDLEDNR